VTYARSRPESDAKIIAEVRRFNRLYTRQLGLLDRHLLDSPFTLTEARVLYELAQRESTIATRIAVDLGLDLGYLSRILKTFERRRYIKRERASADTRQYHISLTALGRERFLPLDRSARAQIASLIAPLPTARRRELIDSMRAVEGLLTKRAQPKSYQLRGLRPGDIGWITHRQAILYQQEYGWDISYEALVAEILAGFVKAFDPKSESAWIAEQDQKIVGSVLLVRASSNIAKLRLLYVEPSARGMGIGRRLVDECIAFARAQGYETLTLWTNSVLLSARRIYEAAGFRLTKQEPHRSFGKDLIGQTWDLDLRVAASRS
jgi:DNA-binding MarR family transcriptional regulator/N-acetylglutamate synthase-like GNAT family acetyltransferase